MKIGVARHSAKLNRTISAVARHRQLGPSHGERGYFEPILASVILEVGLAMLGGAMLKLARTPQEQQPAPLAA